MENLFAYGTLQDPGVQFATLGKIIPGVPDALEGYSTEPLVTDGETYQCAIPDAASTLQGKRYAVTTAELARIDEYEGEQYTRVKLLLESGVESWVYIHADAEEKNGFTLIELLVVIAIIGILSAVVLASLQSARAKAVNSGLEQQLDQYKTALFAGKAESDTWPDTGDGGGSHGAGLEHCLGFYPANACGLDHAVSGSDALNNALSAYIGSTTPQVPLPVYVTVSGSDTYLGTWLGYVYQCFTTSPCTRYSITWWEHAPGGTCLGGDIWQASSRSTRCTLYVGDWENASSQPDKWIN